MPSRNSFSLPPQMCVCVSADTDIQWFSSGYGGVWTIQRDLRATATHTHTHTHHLLPQPYPPPPSLPTHVCFKVLFESEATLSDQCHWHPLDASSFTLPRYAECPLIIVDVAVLNGPWDPETQRSSFAVACSFGSNAIERTGLAYVWAHTNTHTHSEMDSKSGLMYIIIVSHSKHTHTHTHAHTYAHTQ